MPPRRQSAIAELDTARFGGPTNDEERDIEVGTTESELLKPDPDRLVVIISNNGTGPVNISTISPVTTARGLPIGEGSVLVLSAFDDGSMVGRRWFVVAAIAATPVTVNEVVRAHPGG